MPALIASAIALGMAAPAASAACAVWASGLALGGYDPSDPVAVVQGYDIEVRCDAGELQFELALGQSATSGTIEPRAMRHAFRPETLHYNLYQDAAAARIWGDDGSRSVQGTTAHGRATVPVYVRIDPLQDVWIGDYHDEVVLTVLP